MKSPSQIKNADRRTLHPGEFAVVSSEDLVLHTLLGSCVAACLYDPVNKVIGMNHFLLSNRRYSRSLPYTEAEAGRYGVFSMELLINAMLKKGAARKNLRAKAFGGASVFNTTADNFFCVGEVNARFIRDFLETEKIPLLREDLGGTDGRVIYFFKNDFSVYVRKVKKIYAETIARQEKRYWKKSLVKQTESKDSGIELWR